MPTPSADQPKTITPPPPSGQMSAPIAPAQQPHVSTNRRFASLRTISALVLREMSTQYGRTPGGYIWAVLEPLAAILFLSLGFSLVIRTPTLGTSFLLFYASGYLPFGFYSSIANKTARSIKFSSSLLKYPAVSWVDAVLARFFLNSMTEILVGALLIGGILILVDAHAVFSPLPVLEALALLLLLGLGVGTLNCVLMGLFPLWDTAWSIINRPLFLASGVFFIYDDLSREAQNLIWYNPLIHIVGIFRSGIYPTYSADYANPMYVLFVALTLLTLGLILMSRYHRDVLNRR